jgi:hypothetical protein
MNALIRLLNKTGLLQSDVDYHLIRASMVLILYSCCSAIRSGLSTKLKC